MYFYSISMILLVGLLYLTRTSQYNFPLKLDYSIYLILNETKITVSTLSRLYNLAFAIYMFSAVVCIKQLFKISFTKVFILILPIIYFTVYTDPITTKALYFYKHSVMESNANLAYYFIELGSKIARYSLYFYMILPVYGCIKYYFNSKIFVKRRNALIYGACIVVINLFVYYTCFTGAYKGIMFWNVGVSKLPDISIGYQSYLYIPLILLAMICLIITFIIYYEPFNTISIINWREKIDDSKALSKNFRMTLHTYKNAFIGIKHLITLAEDNMKKCKYDNAMRNISMSIDIVNENLDSLNRIVSMEGSTNKIYSCVDVTECIKKALSTQSVSEFADIHLNLKNTDVTDICTYGNAERLTEVFRNLFLNSIEAMKEKNVSNPTIDISIFTDEDMILVEIKDNGMGITRKNKRKIFRPFFTTKSSKNSGVGLNYVVNELRNLNGEIRAESVYGQYTIMKIVLPLYVVRGDSFWKRLLK